MRYGAARTVDAPWISPDESIYGLLARSLWETGSRTLFGTDAWGYSLVYPAVIGLPLRLSDLALGVQLVQALQAVVMSATAVVVYLWGRGPLGRTWAVVAAALSLAIPGLAYTSLLMSEAVSYPVTTLALAAIAAALVRPSPARQALVLGAIALALLTHVRALALLPALFLAVGLQCAFERSLDPARRQAGLLAATVTGVVVTVAGFAVSGAWNGVLGTYAAAAGGYEVGAAAADSVWHLGGVFVLVAGIPLVAAVLMLAECVAGREGDPAARALVATAAAWTVAIVLEVGTFASRWLEHLAERDLLGAAPPLFLVFGLWLRRGVPKPRSWVRLAVLAVAAPAVLLPLDRFAVQEAALDAFAFIPLWRFREWTSTETLELAFALCAAALVAAAVFVPPRARVVLPAVVGLVLAGLSVVSAREVGRLSGLERTWIFDTADPRWIDAARTGPVTYLHAGGAYSVGVWQHAFWNRRVTAVAALPGGADLGPLTPLRLELAADGSLRAPAGGSLDTALLVAPAELELVGSRIAVGPRSTDLSGLAIWRVELPLRLHAWRTGVLPNGDIGGEAQVTVYRCPPGRFELTLFGKEGGTVEIRRDGLTVARRELPPGAVWDDAIAAPPGADGSTTCDFDVVSEGLVGSTKLVFVREG